MLFELLLPDVPADPLQVAARLQTAPGVALLYDATGSGPSFVGCRPIEVRGTLDPEPALALASEPGRAVPRWIGVVPYESRRQIERGQAALGDERPAPPLLEPVWQRYAAVVRVQRDVRVVGDDRAAVQELARLVQRSAAEIGEARLELAQPPEADALHIARIERALELIRAGQLYQVNLARRFVLQVHGSRLGLLAQLAQRAPSPFAAWLELGEAGVVSSSPEAFLELDADRTVWTSPIKGTRPRREEPAADAQQVRELDADPKERAELTMILDVERNDLGRVCRAGTIQLAEPPTVKTYGPVHHRVATLRGELRYDVTRAELLAAMCPSGSVTGAPKLRAMAAIAELEAHRRGLYTGCYGAVMHDGTLKLAMAIRCLTLVEGQAYYFSGGGIVADSDPERELQETHWKARQLGALGLERKEEAWVSNNACACS